MRLLLTMIAAVPLISYGQAAKFDGTTGYAEFGNVLAGLTSLTVVVWTTRDASGGSNSILNHGSDSTYRGPSVYVQNVGHTGMTVYNDSQTSYDDYDVTRLTNTSMTCLAFTWDQNHRMYVFQDGRYCTGTFSKAGTQPTSISPRALRIGCTKAGGSPFSYGGVIDGVRIFSKAITQREAHMLCQAAWALDEDQTLISKSCIPTNDTGTAITGQARNEYGAAGTWYGSVTAFPGRVQHDKPLEIR